MFGKILFIVGIIFIIASIFASCNRGYRHWASPEEKAAWMVERVAKELELNDGQKEKLNEIKEEVLAKRDDFKDIRKEFHDEILSQVQRSSVDAENLNVFFEERETKIKEMRAFMVEKFAEFHSTLTADQRVILIEKLEKLKKYRR